MTNNQPQLNEIERRELATKILSESLQLVSALGFAVELKTEDGQTISFWPGISHGTPVITRASEIDNDELSKHALALSILSDNIMKFV